MTITAGASLKTDTILLIMTTLVSLLSGNARKKYQGVRALHRNRDISMFYSSLALFFCRYFAATRFRCFVALVCFQECNGSQMYFPLTDSCQYQLNQYIYSKCGVEALQPSS